MTRTVTKRPLGKHGPTVSSIGLGTIGMSDLYGKADRAESVATLHATLDAGINLVALAISTAYGSADLEFLAIAPSITRATRRNTPGLLPTIRQMLKIRQPF